MMSTIPLVFRTCYNKKQFSKSTIKSSIFASMKEYKPTYNSLKTPHTKKLDHEKRLVMQVLEAIPSKREAVSYLKKYGSQPAEIQLKKETFPVALINVQAPMEKSDLVEVAKNIVYLHRLGISPIVTLENNEWYECNLDLTLSENYQKVRKLMIQDALSFCELLELENVQSRLITSGAFETKEPLYINKQPIINSEVDVKPILSCLKTNSIPVLIPISSTPGSHFHITSSVDTVPALSKAFSRYSKQTSKIDDKFADVVKVIMINPKGGVLSKNNKTILFINLEEEYHRLNNYYQKNNIPCRDLQISYSCLSYLPATASAVILKASSTKAVIRNLITDKPLVNQSLHAKNNIEGMTVLRYGLELKVYRSIKSVDIEKLFNLMELSFGKKLNKEIYKLRLSQVLDKIIIAGDYQGCAIMTKEPSNDTIYLDKFSVDPRSQGIGVADILWQEIRKAYTDLMWRSRGDNGVNKWYFERCDGNLRAPDSHWVMFWYGTKGIFNISQNLKTAQSIPPSFLPGEGREPTK